VFGEPTLSNGEDNSKSKLLIWEDIVSRSQKSLSIVS